MKPLLVFDGVSFHYAARDAEGSPRVNQTQPPALHNISLTIHEGEFVAIVGANGSGKSTFARLASALLLPDEGSVWVMGLNTREDSHRAPIHASVGYVFQFPEDQIVGTTVEEDVAFGPENLAMDSFEIRRRVEQSLREVGLWEQRHRPPHMLSAGQTQRLALAGVLAMQPRCILFDEASTMLDPGGRRQLMETMQRLNQSGMTIIQITHFMEEAARASRVIVLQQGRVALDGRPQQVFADEQRLASLSLDLPPAARAAQALRQVLPQLPADLLTLPALEAALPAWEKSGILQPVPPSSAAPSPAMVPPWIEVENLGYVYLRGTLLAHRALENANLNVLEGHAHGLLGRTGSGKSTLLQHLNGLLHPQEGRVRVGSFQLNGPNLDRRQVVRQVGLVFQNPEAQFFEHYVGDEVAFGPRQLQVGVSPGETLAERVRWAMDLVGLDFASYKDRPLFALSGGERRKVALASTLALRPSILLLDEPTAGLDPRSRLELIDKLSVMQASGLTIVLSSHQMEDMVALAQSLTVFDAGRDVFSGPVEQVFSQVDLLHQHGLEPPIAAQLADHLSRSGWPIHPQLIHLGQLTSAIASSLREAQV